MDSCTLRCVVLVFRGLGMRAKRFLQEFSVNHGRCDLVLSQHLEHRDRVRPFFVLEFKAPMYKYDSQQWKDGYHQMVKAMEWIAANHDPTHLYGCVSTGLLTEFYEWEGFDSGGNGMTKVLRIENELNGRLGPLKTEEELRRLYAGYIQTIWEHRPATW